jgi:alkylresorcinol/alkylpyrone synthase
MSSATVLFILRGHLEGAGGAGADDAPVTPAARRVCAMAFGPGLTVESALLTRRVGA